MLYNIYHNVKLNWNFFCLLGVYVLAEKPVTKPVEKKLFVRDATGLVKEFNALDIFTIVMSQVVGGSWVLLPFQMWGQYPGGNYLVGFAISAVPLFLGTAATYCMAVAMPRSGGSYIWTSRLLSAPLGYILAWTAIIGGPIGNAGVMVLGGYYLAQSIQLISIGTHNPALLPLAQVVASGPNLWVITIAAIVLFSLPAFFGGRIFKGFVYFTTLTMLAGFVILIILVYATPSASFPSLWDQTFGPGAYQQVAAAATKRGWTESSYLRSDPTASMSITVAAMLMWGGLSHWASWLPGEARRPARSIFAGTFGAGITALVLGLLLSGAAIHVGQAFITQLWVARADLPYLVGVSPGLPIIMAVVAPAFGPVVVGLVMVISGMIFYYSLKNATAFVVMLSRAPFALSFDRMFPEKLSELKFRHQPVYSYMLFVFLLAFYAALGFVIGVWALAGWYAFGLGLIAVFMGLSCAVMPYSKRDIYEAAPRFVQRRVAGVPLVTIVGSVSAASWMFLLGNSLKSIIDGPNGLYILLVQVLVYFVGGIVLFAYYNERNARNKIAVKEIYEEIPPE
jgi:amino acid transporter